MILVVRQLKMKDTHTLVAKPYEADIQAHSRAGALQFKGLYIDLLQQFIWFGNYYSISRISQEELKAQLLVRSRKSYNDEEVGRKEVAVMDFNGDGRFDGADLEYLGGDGGGSSSSGASGDGCCCGGCVGTAVGIIAAFFCFFLFISCTAGCLAG